MPLDSAFIRNMKQHVARNEFHKINPEGTIIEIPENLCNCKQWKVGSPTCVCKSQTIFLDYSETTNEVFPSKMHNISL